MERQVQLDFHTSKGQTAFLPLVFILVGPYSEQKHFASELQQDC